MNHKTRMELLWIIAVLIILVGSALMNVYWVEENRNNVAQETSGLTGNLSSVQVIQVQGRQWSWTFTNSTGIPTVNNFTVKANETVLLVVSSGDVIHDLLIPQMGIQVYAVPGQNNTIQFTPVRAGTFFFECAEYCGEYHYQMRGLMTVVQ